MGYKLTRRKALLSLAAAASGFAPLTKSFSAQKAVPVSFAFSEGDPPTSYRDGTLAVGIFPDLISALFQLSDTYDAEVSAYPWARAKRMVEQGFADAFCTYPSKSKQEYANFQKDPLYTDDFGYIIYNKENPNTKGIENVKSFEDLKSYRLLTEGGDGWELENVPDFIERINTPSNEAMLNLCFRRNAGEFFIKSIHEAKYQAQINGYSDQLGYVKVDFIPDATLPFHIGISKKRPDALQIIKFVDEAMESPDFELISKSILSRYM